MKCFYVYTEEEACFDCGVKEKNIFGYYRGEPNAVVMMRIAKKIYKDLDPEQFEKHVTVSKYMIIYNDGWNKVIHQVKKFELEDI